MSGLVESNLKQTPFHKFHIENGAKMVPFAGYEMPIQYTGMTGEHLAVRENVGLFDISHMGEFELSGPDSLALIQRITVNDASILKDGEIQYSCMCYENGGIIDDLLIYRLSENRYMLVVNASNLQKDFDWIRNHLDGDVALENQSDKFGLLALQGPNAVKVIQKTSGFDFSQMEYYTNAVVNIAGHDILLSRTGYTGEDGFEVYIPNEMADEIWMAFVDAGKEFDMQLIGLGARDSLRLEMKMSLYGNDIDQNTSPIEASLGWIVNFDKGDFIARDILLNQKQEKPKERLICLELEGRLFPRHGYKLFHEGEEVGRVTSGIFSPTLQKPIAMAYLKRSLTKIGRTVEMQIRDKFYTSKVIKPPFYKKGTHK